MKVRVIVGFSETNGTSHHRDEVVEFADAYATRLVELGKVEVVGDKSEASKANPTTRKASIKNAGKKVLHRRGRR